MYHKKIFNSLLNKSIKRKKNCQKKNYPSSVKLQAFYHFATLCGKKKKNSPEDMYIIQKKKERKKEEYRNSEKEIQKKIGSFFRRRGRKC